MSLRRILTGVMSCAFGMLVAASGSAGAAAEGGAALADDADGRNWAAFGRTYGEQHYSPLDGINAGNVAKLGLAWSLDLPPGNAVTGPVAVDGVIYVASGYSVLRAIDAASGKLLWLYDPKVPEAAGHKLRTAWGSRGIAWWNGKVYTGTADGRLIAVDAKTGRPVWSVMTVDRDDVRFISGAPRVFDGKVIIGHGGADFGPLRGYVTTYDAETGRQLWRFHTVPGDPAKGFEDAAMEMAAKTWAGEWWKHGGGGNVWNAFTYDADTDTIILGTGNGSPWNRRIRSADQGDNLFLCSIVALDAKTGAYRWHYQVNPGESWDYNSSMDMQLAELVIEGRTRKVLMTAPKNGFFYVIDRTNGRLISAEPIARVSWAERIDIATGRPVEVPGARYPDGGRFVMWPGPVGAHSWLPMAYSPKSKLAYVPVIEMATRYHDAGIDPRTWQRSPHRGVDGGAHVDFLAAAADPLNGTSSLLAWNPATQKPAWKLPTPGFWNGGVMATGGDLVFQGRIDRRFDAYEAGSGRLLWSFNAEAPVIAPPITYTAHGRQYVTVLTGMATSGAGFGPMLERFHIDYRTQARRVLTFALDARGTLPPSPDVPVRAVEDPGFVPDPVRAARADDRFGRSCGICHGVNAVAAGGAPDLRASAIPLDARAFAAVVRDGALVPRGMPRYEEFTDEQLGDLAFYIRTQAAGLRARTVPGDRRGDAAAAAQRSRAIGGSSH